jgi:hypothetical protein
MDDPDFDDDATCVTTSTKSSYKVIVKSDFVFDANIKPQGNCWYCHCCGAKNDYPLSEEDKIKAEKEGIEKARQDALEEKKRKLERDKESGLSPVKEIKAFALFKKPKPFANVPKRVSLFKLHVDEGPKELKCYVCSRPESFVQAGYPMPVHGKMGTLFRPSQLKTLLHTYSMVNEPDTEGWTPLHSACVKGNIPMVEELLKQEALVHLKTKNGHTALHLAVYAGSYGTVKMLLEQGVKQLNIATSFELKTPLHLAVEGNWKEIAILLINYGADVNAKDKMERTCMHMAASLPNDRADLGALLIKAGADFQALDVHGWTARQFTELHQNQVFLELLVRAGMTEKMPVIKEMPKAEWHCGLWDGLVNSQKERSEEGLRNKIKVERLQKESEIAREKIEIIIKNAKKKEIEDAELLLIKEEKELRRLEKAKLDAPPSIQKLFSGRDNNVKYVKNTYVNSNLNSIVENISINSFEDSGKFGNSYKPPLLNSFVGSPGKKISMFKASAARNLMQTTGSRNGSPKRRGRDSSPSRKTRNMKSRSSRYSRNRENNSMGNLNLDDTSMVSSITEYH